MNRGNVGFELCNRIIDIGLPGQDRKQYQLDEKLVAFILCTLSAKTVTYFPFYRLNVPNQM